MSKEPKKPKSTFRKEVMDAIFDRSRPKGAKGHAAKRRDKKNRDWRAGLRPDYSSILNN